jgi:hypothetical protein
MFSWNYYLLMNKNSLKYQKIGMKYQ